MTNFATSEQILETALNSSGSAMSENEKVLDSIQGKYQSFQSAFEQLSTSIIEGDFVKTLLDFGTNLLKIANTDGVKFIATMGLIAGTLTILRKGFGIAGTSIQMFRGKLYELYLLQQGYPAHCAKIIAGNKAIVASNMGLSTSFNTLKTAMLSNPIFWGTLIISGLYGISKAIDALTVSYEEQQEKVENLNQAYEETKGQVTETEDKLAGIQGRIEALEKLDSLSIVEQKELERLKTENTLLQEQLAMLEKEAKLKEEERRKSTYDLLKTSKDTSNESDSARERAFTYTSGEPLAASVTASLTKLSEPGNVEFNIGSIKALREANEALRKEQSSLNQETGVGAVRFGLIRREIEQNDIAITTLENETNGFVLKFNDYIDVLEGGDAETEALRQKLIGLRDEYIKMTPSIQDNIKATDDAKKSQEEINAELNKLSTIAENISAIQSLSDAYKEFREDGVISAETLGKLEEKFENSKDKIVELQKAMQSGDKGAIKSSIEEIIDAYIREEIAIGGLTEATKNQYVAELEAMGVKNSNAAITQALANNELDAALKTGTLTAAMVNEAAANGLAANSVEYFKKQLELMDVNKAIENIDRLGGSFGGLIGSALAAAKATLNARKAALGEEIEDLENLKVNVNVSGIKLGSGFGSPSKKSGSSKSTEKEWWEKETEKLKQQFDYSEITIETYIKGLEKVLGKLKKGSDAWKKVNDELQKLKLDKLKDDFSESRITVDEYIKGLQNLQKQYKKNTETYKELDSEIKKAKLDKIKDDFDNNRISIARYIEELKKLQKQYKQNTEEYKNLAEEIKNSLIEQQEEYKSKYEQAYSAIEKTLDSEIERINELIEAKQKANEETKDEIELARLQEQLEYARRNETRQVWNEAKGKFDWLPDETAIKDAETELNDFLSDQEIKELEGQIDVLEDYKNEWSDIMSEYEDMQNYKAMLDIVGANAEAAILGRRLETLKEFRNEYLGVQKEIEALGGMTPEQASKIAVKNPQSFSQINFASLSSGQNRLQELFGQSLGSTAAKTVNTDTTNNSSVIYQFKELILPNVTDFSSLLREIEVYTNTHN